MNVEQNKQIVQNFFEAGNRGEMERCMELLADDISWTDIGTTKFSGTYVGKDTLSKDLLGPLFGQLKAGIYSTIENIIAEGPFVVVQSRGAAETTDGKPYNNTYCHVFELRDGKIQAVTEYLDTALTNTVFGA
jgi:ketosteroid isomerase-like protein